MKGFRGHLAVTVTGGLEEVITPWAGASALVEAYRSYGVGDAANRALPKKKTAKGLSQGQMAESFVLLSALGGKQLGHRGFFHGMDLLVTHPGGPAGQEP